MITQFSVIPKISQNDYDPYPIDEPPIALFLTQGAATVLNYCAMAEELLQPFAKT